MVGVYHVGQNLDGAPRVCVLNLLLTALMFSVFTTLCVLAIPSLDTWTSLYALPKSQLTACSVFVTHEH